MGWGYFQIWWKFYKKVNSESDKGYFLEDDVQYPEKYYDFYNVLPFLSEIMKNEKVEQALSHGLVLKKLHRIIKFRQKALLKP